HAALRAAGGAGGVDDGADIAGPHVGDAGLDLILGDLLIAAVVDEDVDGAAVDAQHTGQRLLLGGGAVLRDDVLEALAVLLGLTDGKAGAGVLHDPSALGGRGGRVNRHGDRAGRLDRQVEQRPLDLPVRLD